MFVRPKSGVKVRRPTLPYAHLPEEGAEVSDEPYWHRRLADGDVEQVAKAQPAASLPTDVKMKSRGGAQ